MSDMIPSVGWCEKRGENYLRFNFGEQLTERDADYAIDKWKQLFHRKKDQCISLIWDCQKMKQYESGARKKWTKTLFELKSQIGTIWLISDSAIVKSGAAAMGMATSLKIKTVASDNEINFRFSLTNNNHAAETHWYGDLTYKIIVTGVVSQNQWILSNSDKLPLIFVADFTKASLNNITETDLQALADQFHGEEKLFPNFTWIAIMPSNVKFDIVRLWIEHAESRFSNGHVVRNRAMANDIILNVLNNFNQ